MDWYEVQKNERVAYVVSGVTSAFELFPQSLRSFVSTGKVSWSTVPTSGVADCQYYSSENVIIRAITLEAKRPRDGS